MESQTFQEACKQDNKAFTLFRSGDCEFHGFYAKTRIDRKTVPEGWHVYDLRRGSGDDWFDQLKNGTITDYNEGTFATQTDIGLPEGKSLCRHLDDLGDGVELLDDEWDYEFDEDE